MPTRLFAAAAAFSLAICGSALAQGSLGPVTVTRVTERINESPDLLDDLDDFTTERPSAAETEPPGDRLFFFGHGLNGARTAWGPVAANVHRRYRARHALLEYGDLQDIAYDDLVANLFQITESEWGAKRGADPTIDASRNLFVGHSLGGLMGREMLRHQAAIGVDEDELLYRGLVTFASPHGGALSAVSRPQIHELLSDGCVALTKGPLTSLVSGVPGVLKIGEPKRTAFETVEQLVDSGCVSGAFRGVLNFALVDEALPRVAESMGPDGATIAELSDAPLPYDISTANVMAFEEQPVTLRVISSGLAPVAALDAYSADDDESFIETHEAMIAESVASATELNDRADYEDSWRTPSGGFKWRRKKKARRMRTAAGYYDDGAEWLEDLNDAWLAIVGALHYEDTGEVTYRCDCTYYDYGDPVGGSSYETDDADDCEHGGDVDEECEATVLFVHRKAVYSPSDGAATLDSQRAWEADVNLIYRGSNHFQLRNDSNTEDAINNRLLGSNHPFFATELRNP